MIKKPPFVVEKKDGTLTISPAELARYVEENLNYLTVQESKDFRRMYIYDNGVYRPESREGFTGIVLGFVSDYNPNLVQMSLIREAVSILYITRRTLTNDVLNSKENYINLQNGLLDIETMELLPHDPKVYSTIQLPLMYEPDNVNTEVFDTYLNSLTDGKEDKIRFLLEFIGAVFSNVPGYYLQKALFMFGPGDPENFQLKKLVEKIMGYENCVNINFKQMKTLLGAASIYGKRMAGYSDTNVMTIRDLNIFKQIMCGDRIYAEFKGKGKFQFAFKGLLWFCVNHLPKFDDDNGRWVYKRIVPFRYSNKIHENKTHEEKNLIEKMYEERSGIFNKAIAAYRDVLLNNNYRFHEPKGTERIRRKYVANNNSE